MAEQIEEIVKRGRWFYDQTVPAEVHVIRRNFVDPPHPGDEELPEGEDVCRRPLDLMVSTTMPCSK
jgi:hypothetical protein